MHNKFIRKESNDFSW